MTSFAGRNVDGLSINVFTEAVRHLDARFGILLGQIVRGEVARSSANIIEGFLVNSLIVALRANISVAIIENDKLSIHKWRILSIRFIPVWSIMNKLVIARHGNIKAVCGRLG